MGNYDKIVHLIKERGIDVNMKDAARSNATALHIASRSGHLDIVKFLSESGADLNAKGPWDMTPLMYGIIFHRLEIVKYLLGNNVDATVEDNRGRTALIHAVNERQEEMERIFYWSRFLFVVVLFVVYHHFFVVSSFAFHLYIKIFFEKVNVKRNKHT